MNGVYITHKSLRDKTYLVVPDSLPTVDELDFFGREILLSSPESHSGKITHILDKFLYIYCKQYFGSHLVSLIILREFGFALTDNRHVCVMPHSESRA